VSKKGSRVGREAAPTYFCDTWATSAKEIHHDLRRPKWQNGTSCIAVPATFGFFYIGARREFPMSD
jgi:hypothetical protein